MEIQEIYNKFLLSKGLTTDSRKVSKGQMFLALKGENFDGNLYAEKALEAGASYAIVNNNSEISKIEDPRIIAVDDTLHTLWELARHHRSMIFVDGKPITIIGLTGTNGKTTTKELIREVLSVKYKVTATEGNLNNNIGVPLTLLNIDKETELAVVEMGASHPGDIKELVAIALPNYGLITNVGKAHLLGFGSFEGVKSTKGELYDYIQRTGDKAFVNVDNPHLVQMASERPDLITIPYGLNAQGAQILEASQEHPFLRILIPGAKANVIVETHLVGSYNADNVMAAIAVGKEFGISLEEAVQAISYYEPKNNRSQMVHTKHNTVIIDAYNANPTSMDAALVNFASIKASSKLVLLGDMLELGEESIAEHMKIIQKAIDLELEEICLVGYEFEKALEKIDKTAKIDRIKWFEDSEKLSGYLKEKSPSGKTILVKGSRGIKMENVMSWI